MNAPKARVFVTDSDSWQITGSSGGFGGAGGSHTSGGARPQTAEVMKTVGQRCPELIVNNRADLSDYILRLEHEGGKSMFSHKDKVVVFVRKSGDSIFSNSTLSVGGSVQGACSAIGKHWTANAMELAGMPSVPTALPAPPSVNPPVLGATPQSAPSTATVLPTLTIESPVSGADIEIDGNFVGSTPSTLSVTPGRHTVKVARKGYADWSRTLTVNGPSVHLNADLVKPE